MTGISNDPRTLMRRALRLAARGKGWTSPNPMVGAVLVKDGRIIGEGYHTAVGKAHAEREALADAHRQGHDPAGATMVVNLEPCSHHGRTPPCTEALIEAKVAEVIVAHQDPNPQVNGAGLRELERHGVKLQVGVLGDEAIALNEVYCRYICTERPFVTVKAATTLDGKIATVTGDSKWVSGPAALRYAHWLRHVNDAILVGVETAIADDPQLTCRLGAGRSVRHPLRVVLDSTLRLPETATLVSGKLPGQTLIATTERADNEKRKRLAKSGVLVEIFPPDEAGRVDLAELLVWLRRREVAGLLVEGGGNVHSSFLRAGLADKLALVLAPKLVGGDQARSWLAGVLAERMDLARIVQNMTVRPLGGDWLVEGYFEDIGECLLV
jgi:diaminohydroxyphosphoribosylaminopyrimidine deaminase / 5-amino-6-(5-phosphoribosylamino)uracil reductase